MTMPGEMALQISNMVTKALRGTTGRGPVHSRTTFGQDSIFVVLQDSLTKGERALIAGGEGEEVLKVRALFQKVMRVHMMRQIEEITGRVVIGFMSSNILEPDMGVEVFILAPEEGL